MSCVRVTKKILKIYINLAASCLFHLCFRQSSKQVPHTTGLFSLKTPPWLSGLLITILPIVSSQVASCLSVPQSRCCYLPINLQLLSLTIHNLIQLQSGLASILQLLQVIMVGFLQAEFIFYLKYTHIEIRDYGYIIYLFT